MNRHILTLLALAATAFAQGEPFRPQVHFTPEKNWMNDPNGMVFFEGEWHLFYQYNPHGDKWGHMSWGHSVSRDLVRWEHLPLALAEEDGVMIFSGSAVVDWKNTSGFGKDGQPPLVAIYTGHREGRQDQRLAFSNDRGRAWTKFAGNPVLDVKMADFRDPKVFWHEATARWVMTVALSTEKKVHFYKSENLKQWKYAGEFGGAGATNGLWECLDLFPLAIEGGGTKWVLIVNINPDGPAGGSGCQYFVGDFDGAHFKAENDATRWADYGADFYAGVSWSDVPKTDGRRVWLGWMSNWLYAQDVPTSPWRSAMTVPRELALRRTPDGLRLVQKPVAEFEKLREPDPRKFPGGTSAAAAKWLAAQANLPMLLDIEISFTGMTPKTSFALRLHTAKDEHTTIALDAARSLLAVDRTHSGRTNFHREFSARHEAPLRIADGRCTVRMLVDTSSLEVFAQNGETVLTDLIFPAAGPRSLSITTDGDEPGVSGITIHALKSAR
ncbi:MAG: glycoside hydrolase family 32 protein [Chthoniobacteraceae bacterium]